MAHDIKAEILQVNEILSNEVESILLRNKISYDADKLLGALDLVNRSFVESLLGTLVLTSGNVDPDDGDGNDNDIYIKYADPLLSFWQKISGTWTKVVEVSITSVIGLWDDRGSFSASGGSYPSTGGSGVGGAILKGDIWTISVAGTLPTGQVVEVGDVIRALTDTPGNTQANWAILQNNIGYVAENSANKDTDVTLVANSDIKYPSQKAVKTYVDNADKILRDVGNTKTTIYLINNPSVVDQVNWYDGTLDTDLESQIISGATFVFIFDVTNDFFGDHSLDIPRIRLNGNPYFEVLGFEKSGEVQAGKLYEVVFGPSLFKVSGSDLYVKSTDAVNNYALYPFELQNSPDVDNAKNNYIFNLPGFTPQAFVVYNFMFDTTNNFFGNDIEDQPVIIINDTDYGQPVDFFPSGTIDNQRSYLFIYNGTSFQLYDDTRKYALVDASNNFFGNQRIDGGLEVTGVIDAAGYSNLPNQKYNLVIGVNTATPSGELAGMDNFTDFFVGDNPDIAINSWEQVGLFIYINVNGFTYLSANAFINNTEITYFLDLWGQIKGSDTAVLKNATNLLEVNFPGLNSIGEDFINGCSSAEIAYLPSVKSYGGGGAFAGCTNLTSLTVLATGTDVQDFEDFYGRKANILGNLSSVNLARVKTIDIASNSSTVQDDDFKNATSIELVINSTNLIQPPFTFDSVLGTITMSVTAGDVLTIFYK